MDHFVVDGKLTSAIVDDENTNAATAVGERVLESREEVALVNDWKALLDIAILGHGHNSAIVTNVQDAVLLEDWPQHALNNDGWCGVADEARLLVQLLGEEVDAEVAVLSSLGGGADADNLARTALEDEQVTDADVMGWNGNGVGA